MQLIESLQNQIEMQQDQTKEAVEQTAQPELDKQLQQVADEQKAELTAQQKLVSDLQQQVKQKDLEI